MSNTYVKKYDVGQIKLDLPYANYIHELPLLSFGDVQHTINLSLVYNYSARKREIESGYTGETNPFNIASGFKLNLQKRLIKDNQGYPIEIQEENGDFVSLNQLYSNTYTFKDESQRILRITEKQNSTLDPSGNIIYDPDSITYTYTVEYPDFSKEKYNDSGLITTVYDKYNNVVLSYEYNENEQLQSIHFTDSKTILFEYDESNLLKSVSYAEHTSNFFYDNSYMLAKIEHYSGDVYEFTLSGMNYTVASKDGNDIIASSKELELKDNNMIEVIDKIKGETINQVLYKYPYDLSYDMSPYSYVDIVNKNGVETRMQFLDGKATCSYEVKNGVVQFGGDGYQSKVLSNVTFYKATRAYDNFEAAGVQTRCDGNTMNIPDSFATWSFNPGKSGYYMLSGWIKLNGGDGIDHNISIGNHSNIMEEYDLGRLYVGQWKYFSIMFYSSGTVYVNGGTNNVSLRDLRLTFQADANSMSEYVLFYGNETIPFRNVDFYYRQYGEEVEFKNVTFSDILKYKLRKKKYNLYYEGYSENCTNIIKDITDIKIFHNESYISISELDLGVRAYSDEKELLTRISIDENNPDTDIVKTQTVGDDEVSTETLNSKLDNKETTSDGIKVSYQYDYDTERYQSTGRGLIFVQTTMPITDADDTNTIVKQYNYDAGLAKLVSTVDEFGNITSYTTDDTWGVVTAVTLPDGSVITDTYDGDMSVLKKKAFDSSETRKNVFGYTDGRVTSITGVGLSYGFGYTDKGELASVTKSANTNTNTIEEHEQTDTTLDIYYPTKEDALYSFCSDYDKYGRLIKTDGCVENVYGFYPSYVPTEMCPMQEPNSCAVLKKTKDLQRNEEYEYSYDEKCNLAEAVRKNSAESEVSREAFAYDESKRIVTDSCTYDSVNSKSVSSNITYISDADNRVSNYSFGVNGTIKAQTANQYDAYKRISQKTYAVSGMSFIKKINYTKTRATSVEDKCVNTTIANTSYGYDAMGRISSINNMEYAYDTYGQLTEEKNITLDKSTQYVYNNIGNIVSVTKNGVTTQLGYDTAQPDWLIWYGGKAITYNTHGGVSSYDGWDYTWSKGKLSTIRKILSGTSRALIAPVLMPSKTYSYTYNGYGQRVGKSYSYIVGAPGMTDVYRGMPIGYDKKFHYDQSGRLIAEDSVNRYYDEMDETDHIVYLYDESGIIGMEYTATSGATNTYYFQRNIQGDVIGIYNTNGTKVGGYAYDAWGNCTITLDTNGIASRNPIRYRGYYFDSETGFYYLNARYYNPEWRRFISPDDTAFLDSETPNGLNLYCYCGNDPVNYADPSGNDPLLIALLIGLGIGVAAGLGYAAYTDYQDNYDIDGSIGWQRYLGYSIIGGALGAGIGFGIGYWWPAIATFLGSSFSFSIPTFGLSNVGGALALVGGTTVAVTGAQIATGVLGGLIIMFSWGASRYTPKDTRSNYVQNEEFERICDEYGLNKTQRNRIHHRITKKGLTPEQIRKLIERLYPNLRR